VLKFKLFKSLLLLAAILVLIGCSTPSTGSVKGIVINNKTGKPVEVSLELWAVEVGEDGQTASILPNLEREAVESNKSGEFMFNDVEPGHYMIFVETGMSLTALEVEERGNALVIEVKAGEVVDLGEIQMNY